MAWHLEEGVIKEEEEVLASLSQEVGGHVVLQLRAEHAVHASPAPLHPIQMIQSFDDGRSSIQIPGVLSGLHYRSNEYHNNHMHDNAYYSNSSKYNKENVCGWLHRWAGEWMGK